MSRSPLYLTVEETGPPAFRRWRLVDRAGRAWTGSGWSAAPNAGLLFGTNQSACFEAQKILMTDHVAKPVRRFLAPVYIDVYSDEEFGVEQLRHWLVRAARLNIDYAGAGFGPLNDSLGLLRIEWGNVREGRT